MSGPNEEATTVDASQTSAATALDVNAAARLKQLDAREQSLTAREQAIKERERQVKDQAGAIKEREAEVEAAKTKVQRDLADLAKRQKQVAETESSLEARSRDLAQREIEASEGFATKNREALSALSKAHASLRAEVERLQAELDAARLKGVEDLEKRLADERRTRTEALDAEIEAERKRHLAKLATEGAAQDAALGDQFGPADAGGLLCELVRAVQDIVAGGGCAAPRRNKRPFSCGPGVSAETRGAQRLIRDVDDRASRGANRPTRYTSGGARRSATGAAGCETGTLSRVTAGRFRGPAATGRATRPASGAAAPAPAEAPAPGCPGGRGSRWPPSTPR